MGMGWQWICFCVLWILTGPCRGINLDELTIDVILLDDEESPWSLKFVKDEILKAIELDQTVNAADGNTIRKHKDVCICTQNYDIFKII